MSPRSRQFVGLPPVPRALRLLTGLNPDQFEELARAVASRNAFSSDWERATQLAAELGVSDPGDIVTILSSLEFLYDRTHNLAAAPSESTSALQDFLRLSGLWSSLGENPDAGFKRLQTLLAPNAAADRQRKRRWLLHGALENAASFASFVDLRPNYTRDRSSIEELLPVIVFRISTETDDDREYTYTFQMTTASLIELKTVIEDTFTKLRCLSDDAAISPRLFFDQSIADSKVGASDASL
jgi:hypothetical protein